MFVIVPHGALMLSIEMCFVIVMHGVLIVPSGKGGQGTSCDWAWSTWMTNQPRDMIASGPHADA